MTFQGVSDGKGKTTSPGLSVYQLWDNSSAPFRFGYWILVIVLCSLDATAVEMEKCCFNTYTAYQ